MLVNINDNLDSKYVIKVARLVVYSKAFKTT